LKSSERIDADCANRSKLEQDIPHETEPTVTRHSRSNLSARARTARLLT
jgi:hypothetical protein